MLTEDATLPEFRPGREARCDLGVCQVAEHSIRQHQEPHQRQEEVDRLDGDRKSLGVQRQEMEEFSYFAVDLTVFTWRVQHDDKNHPP